jgi:Sulfotransferase domain
MTTPRADRFFIAGCQRSGTTLLRLVLESHPDVFCLDEDTSYPVLAAGDRVTTSGWRKVGFKVPRFSEQFAEPLAADEGLGVTVPAFYKGEPIVYLYRDPRDVVASMVKLRMSETQTWLEFCARPILESKIRRPEFAERYAAEIAKLRFHGDALPLVGGLYWKYKTEPLFDYQRRGWPVLPLRYEDLVAAPRRQLRRVASFLGLDWDERLLNHHRLPHTELYPDGTAMGNTDPHKPIALDSVGQWKAHLSADDVAGIWSVAGDLSKRLGYGGLRDGVRRAARRARRVLSRLRIFPAS